MEKYRLLYEFARQAYSDEVDRVSRVENKAFALLSVLTLLIGIYGISLDWVIRVMVPPQGCLEWWVLAIATLLLVSLVASWIFFFRSVSVDTLAFVAPNKSVRQFYSENREIDIFCSMADRFAEAAEHNREKARAKSSRNARGYWGIMTSGGLLLITLLLIGAHTVTTHQEVPIHQVRIIDYQTEEEMSDDDNGQNGNGSEESTEQKPDPDVNAPDIEYIREGYDPEKRKPERKSD